MPEAVETPAPVSAVIRRAVANNSRAWACAEAGSLPGAVTPPRCHVAQITGNPGVAAAHKGGDGSCEGTFARR
ncbi:hypothetical protein GCM10027271_33990 [Saccharopolyspora gloriosae]